MGFDTPVVCAVIDEFYCLNFLANSKRVKYSAWEVRTQV